MKPFVSICIPAYKRPDLLRVLLESIAIQTWRDFEVVVTDDSPDDQVAILCEEFSSHIELRYFHHEQALGTPENWNAAIRHAKGEWIKLMHDDDWFAFPDSLQRLVKLTEEASTDFVFCGSTTIEHHEVVWQQKISTFSEKLLKKDPRNLFHLNFIGPPSVVMHRNDGEVWYDKRMKWLVDIDFYIRYLHHSPRFHFTKD